MRIHQLVASILCLVLGGLGLLPVANAASPGDLDRTLHRDGRATASLGEGPVAVALQADGKIVVVGNILPAVGPRDFALARFLPTGELDRGFGGDGTVTTNFGPGNGMGSSGVTSFDAATAVAIQPDGKIVVVGYSNVRNADFFDFDFALARYNPNGTLDDSFGNAGKVTTDFDRGSEDRAFAVALQRNGKIVVAGSSPNMPGINDFALARYHTDGTPDDSFGERGKVITDFTNGFEEARGVAVQRDGKIVAAGPSTATRRSVDFAVARYLANGKLDDAFGRGGQVVTDFDNDSGDEANAMTLQADGKIVVVGLHTSDGIRFAFAVARYWTDGALDKTFSGDGKVITNFANNSSDRAFGVAVQPDNKIVVVGDSLFSTQTDEFAVARYNSNGKLDTTFGRNGLVLTDFTGQFGISQSDAANAVALQKDGKIVVAGTSAGFSGGFAVARYRNFLCNGLDATILGTQGDDVINGTNGDDVIHGLDGNDTIRGRAGDDVLCGGAGNDTLLGGSGMNVCDGGPGDADRATNCAATPNVP